MSSYNIGSRSGISPRKDVIAYATSKAAVRHLSKSIATYCSSQGYSIRCNCVNPGAIHTSMWNQLTSRESIVSRVGEPGDVADLIVFLASEKAKYIQGAELSIDGGTLLV